MNTYAFLRSMIFRWSSLTALFFAVAIAFSAPAVRPPPKPSRAVPRTDCVTADCHAGVKKHDVIHGPVNVDACDACHTPVSEAEHTFTLARKGGEICTFCHEIDLKNQPVVHKPLATGECLGCHDPHGGSQRSLLKAASVDELCKTCHEDVIGGKRVVHGPVAAGVCGACHAPHTSRHPHLLAHEGAEACLQCHVSTKTQIETARAVHGPAASDCQVCHDAHASDHAMMLRAEPKPLCEGCHEQIRHTVATAQTQHAAVTEQRACLNCHDPHATDFPRVLKHDMRTLCFECHDRQIDMPDGRKLANIKAVLETGKSLHGPVAQSNCAACHQIHGGPNFRLLIREYPPEFYAPFKQESYALCFKCHDAALVRDPKTTALTDFRNGDTNLHFLHVNKEKKGRTCRACHETHAGNREKHIRDGVPFGRGGWVLPINYEKLGNGGRCAPGCHFPYEYNRINPVQFEHRKEPAVWPSSNGQPATQPSGQGAPS